MPRIGRHPDLFEGESDLIRPLNDLTEEELIQLPRAAFSQDEWDDLYEEDQEAIYENDEESKDRIKTFVDAFKRQYKWITEWDDSKIERVEDQLDYNISDNADRLYELWDQTDDLVEEFTAQGYSQEQVEQAINETLQDNNMYNLEQGSEYGKAMFKLGVGEETIYFEKAEIEEILERMFEDEIERALSEIDSETYLDIRQIRDHLKPDRLKYGFEMYVESDIYIDADPKYDEVKANVAELLGDIEPEKEEVLTPPEERTIYKFDDGFYVLDLLPSELPAEGKTMGMCVGRPDMGYIKAVKNGEIKIMSLRRPSGKPLLTFELGLSRGQITEVLQIKGKANRLPGWDLGKAGQGTIKMDEVNKALEFLDYLDIDPESVDDLKPAISHRKALPPKSNPVKKCTNHPDGTSSCSGFCKPYSRRR